MDNKSLFLNKSRCVLGRISTVMVCLSRERLPRSLILLFVVLCALLFSFSWLSYLSVSAADISAPPLSVVDFSAAEYSTVENSITTTITVELDKPSSDVITVTFIANNESAILGSDYFSATSVITFATGVQVNHVILPISDDFFDEEDEIITLILTDAVNAELGNTNNPAILTILDNDSAGFYITPTVGLQTTEAGGQAVFTVKLTSQPRANVEFGLASSDLTEGTVNRDSVVFTPENWNVLQEVIISGVDDVDDDEDIAYTIITLAATSEDGKYNGKNPDDVIVVNRDNEVKTFLSGVLRNYDALKIYFDDFSTDNGWDVYAAGGGGGEIIAGEYRLHHLGPNQIVEGIAPIGISDLPGGYSIQVNARWLSGSSLRYGIIFNWADTSNFYVLFVDSSVQSYAIWKYQSGWYRLCSGTSTNINTAGAVNRLRIERIGSTISLYVNNVFVDNTSDNSFTGGLAGLAIWAVSENGEARFDDFEVKRIP